MVLKAKHPYPMLILFFFILYFSSRLLSLGYQIPRQKTEIDRCIDQCREEEEDVSGLFACAARCDRKYAGTEWEPEGSDRALQHCQKRCESEEGGRRQQQECQRRCEEEVRERGQREREREQQRERRKREEKEERVEEQEEGERQREDEREEREREQERERETEHQRERREREEREQREEEQEEMDRKREHEREEREQREEEREEMERHREREREERERDRRREREEISRDNIYNYPRDPEEEYKECLQICKKQPARQEPQCKRRCKRQYEDVKRNLQQEGRDQLLQSGVGDGDENHHEPHQRYEQCQKQCERQESERQQQQRCKSWCQKDEEQRQKEERMRKRLGQCIKQCEMQESGEQKQRCKSWCEKDEELRQKEESRRKGEQNPQRESREEEEQQRYNPYYFHAQGFQYRFRSQEGHIKVLQRFSQRSEQLRGIDNYRLAILEANPSTLVVPHHSDAETILVVVRGRGIITLVSQERRESFNMELGDVLRVPAGITAYLINQENNENLQIALLIRPINTPGQFREYFAAGGGNPESYYKVFTHEILQRALNTPSDQLERLFQGQQRQHGPIRRATPEQLRALSQHSSPKQRGKESSGPFNLPSQKPLYHNNFGRFFEATPNDFKQLQESGASVTYVEINQGAMMVPHYNSKSTTIVLVVQGRGRVEMGCPHLSRPGQGSQEKMEQTEKEEESSGQLQKITARLSPGDVFIIPAGHPVALVAENENFLTVGFGINALYNQRNFLGGKINIMNQVEKEAMEIAFNVPARLVERIFSNNPKESYFVAGPELAGPEEEPQREEGRGHSLPSVLDLAGFF